MIRQPRGPLPRQHSLRPGGPWAVVVALASMQLACAEAPQRDEGFGGPGYVQAFGTAGMPGDAQWDPEAGAAGAGPAVGVGAEPSEGGDAMPGTAGGDGSPGNDDAALARQRTLESFACPGGAIVPGNNTLVVGGKARTFVADFPSDRGAPMGVLFSWHGYNQAEGDHHRSSRLDPNANPALPVVVITPDDLEFELPVGLDWQLDEGSVEKNVDLQFFEAMMGCLDAQYDIDPARIHSLGYSAGSVMTALLHSVYPNLLRSVICISGMWFNDQEQIDNIILAGAVLTPSWPALDPAHGGTILLTHGGLGDIAAGIINLEAMAQSAFPFLAAGGRAVIDCPHGGGHVGAPDVTPEVISRFISDHPSDRPSAGGGYNAFPGSCTLRLP